ncbi:hypothetical protein GCM10023314_03760 [Algibacter agarivorans]|uniref:PKD domain-containing protein n=1 Tax=Algibacter agarivorans TaxID=1109741 RepID=A0ABP9GGV6_9FLAO
MQKNKNIAYSFISMVLVLLVTTTACVEDSNLLDGIRAGSFKATANKLLITEGESITYTDSSQTVSSRVWTFEGGNTATSTDEVVNVSYPSPSPSIGTGQARENQGFSTTLEVTHEDGSVESNLFKVKVFQKVVPDFEAEKTSDLFGSTIQFFDRTLDGQSTFEEGRLEDTILWEFEGGNPATSTERNPFVTYADPGVYSVTLTVGRGVPASIGTTTKEDYMNILLVPLCDETVNLIDCGNNDGEIAGLSNWVARGNSGEDRNANLSVSMERFSEGTASLKYLYEEPGVGAFTNNTLRMENYPFTVTTAGDYTVSMDTFGDLISTTHPDYVFEISTPAAGTTADGPTKQFFRTAGGAWFAASSTKTLQPGDYYVQIKMWNTPFHTDLNMNLFIDNIQVIRN